MYQQMTLFDLENRETEKYVRRVSYADVKPFLLNVHYARRMPCVTDAFGLFLDGEMVGCVTYGVPASPPLCRGIAGDENVDHVLELNRLVISPEIPGGGKQEEPRKLLGFPQFEDASERHIRCQLCGHGMDSCRVCLSGLQFSLHRMYKEAY